MNTLFNAIIFIFMSAITANVAIAEEQAPFQKKICKLLKKEKRSVAYLLDEHGNKSNGPIKFGRYGYTYHVDRGDLFYIPTKYRVVIFPARLHPKPCTTGGCLELKKVTSVCPNSGTYSISYANQEYSENPSNNNWLPYKVNDNVDITPIQDTKAYTGWAEIEFRFDMRVVGEIIDATIE